MRERIEYTIGSMLSIIGAFAIGAVLHSAIIQHTLSLTEPTAVFGIIAGFIVIVAGQHIETQTEHTHTPDSEERETADTFDEELAPLDCASLEQYERDEDYEQ